MTIMWRSRKKRKREGIIFVWAYLSVCHSSQNVFMPLTTVCGVISIIANITGCFWVLGQAWAGESAREVAVSFLWARMRGLWWVLPPPQRSKHRNVKFLFSVTAFKLPLPDKHSQFLFLIVVFPNWLFLYVPPQSSLQIKHFSINLSSLYLSLTPICCLIQMHDHVMRQRRQGFAEVIKVPNHMREDRTTGLRVDPT